MKRLPIVVAALALGACALPTRESAGLDRAWAEYTAAEADLRVVAFARGELAHARDMLQRASSARDTLQDPALIDHLAYVARQRTALSVQLATWRSSAENRLK